MDILQNSTPAINTHQYLSPTGIPRKLLLPLLSTVALRKEKRKNRRRPWAPGSPRRSSATAIVRKQELIRKQELARRGKGYLTEGEFKRSSSWRGVMRAAIP